MTHEVDVDKLHDLVFSALTSLRDIPNTDDDDSALGSATSDLEFAMALLTA